VRAGRKGVRKAVSRAISMGLLPLGLIGVDYLNNGQRNK
jgi:hypothetical protein